MTITGPFPAVASALRGEGFDDAAQIMARIASGEIGGRGRNGPGSGLGRGRDGASKEQRDTFAAEIMSESAAVDEAFTYPRVTAGNLKAVSSEIDPTVAFIGDTPRADKTKQSGADRARSAVHGKGQGFLCLRD